MSELGISNTLVSMNLQCETSLSENNLALSQTLQMFCTEAFRPSMLIGASAANLCGSLFGFKAFSLCSKLFGTSSFATKALTFSAKVISEGAMFHIAPEFLETRSLQTANLFRGSASSTLMVAFSQGAGKLGGGFIVQQMFQDVAVLCSQDLSASLGFSEVQTGGIYTRLLYAQMSSCQMMVGAGITRLSCHEITMMNAQIHLAESLHKTPTRTEIPQGWLQSIRTTLQGAFAPRSANEMPIEAALHQANEQKGLTQKGGNSLFMTGNKEGEFTPPTSVIAAAGESPAVSAPVRELSWSDKLRIMRPKSLPLSPGELKVLPLIVEIAGKEIVQIEDVTAPAPKIKRVLSAEEAAQWDYHDHLHEWNHLPTYARRDHLVIAADPSFSDYLGGFQMRAYPIGCLAEHATEKWQFSIHIVSAEHWPSDSVALTNKFYHSVTDILSYGERHVYNHARVKLEMALSLSGKPDYRYRLLEHYLQLAEQGNSLRGKIHIAENSSEIAWSPYGGNQHPFLQLVNPHFNSGRTGTAGAVFEFNPDNTLALHTDGARRSLTSPGVMAAVGAQFLGIRSSLPSGAVLEMKFTKPLYHNDRVAARAVPPEKIHPDALGAVELLRIERQGAFTPVEFEGEIPRRIKEPEPVAAISWRHTETRLPDHATPFARQLASDPTLTTPRKTALYKRAGESDAFSPLNSPGMTGLGFSYHPTGLEAIWVTIDSNASAGGESPSQKLNPVDPLLIAATEAMVLAGYGASSKWRHLERFSLQGRGDTHLAPTPSELTVVVERPNSYDRAIAEVVDKEGRLHYRIEGEFSSQSMGEEAQSLVSEVIRHEKDLVGSINGRSTEVTETNGVYRFTAQPTPLQAKWFAETVGGKAEITAGYTPSLLVGFSSLVRAIDIIGTQYGIRLPSAQEFKAAADPVALLQKVSPPIQGSVEISYRPHPMGEAIPVEVTCFAPSKGFDPITGRYKGLIKLKGKIQNPNGLNTTTEIVLMVGAQDLSGGAVETIPDTELTQWTKAPVHRNVHEAEMGRVAQITGDHNAVHLSPEAAAALKLRAPILHGVAIMGDLKDAADANHPRENPAFKAKFKPVSTAAIGDELTYYTRRDASGKIEGMALRGNEAEGVKNQLVMRLQSLTELTEAPKEIAAPADVVATAAVTASGDHSGQQRESDARHEQQNRPPPPAKHFPTMQALAAQMVQSSAAKVPPSSDLPTQVTTIEPRITTGEPPAHQVAFLFPGQGSQKVGMGRDLLSDPTYRQIVDTAEKAVPGLKELMQEGPEAGLNLTQNTQPAILTMSVGIAGVLALRGVRANYFAGHSLGEFSALAALGVIPMNFAPHLVSKRGQFMQEAVHAGVGAMAAVIGVESVKLAEICATVSQEKNQTVVIANQNGGGQFVISGHREAVNLVLERVKGGKRVITKLLPVSAPFHSPLMEAAQRRFSPLLRELPFHEIDQPLRTPLVSTVDAAVKGTSTKAFEVLDRQMPAPVLFEPAVQKLLALGVTTFVEVGPGSVLGGLVKRIGPKEGIHIFGTETPDQIEQVVEHCRSIGAMRVTMGVPSLVSERIYPARTMAAEVSSPAEISPVAHRFTSTTIPEILTKLDAFAAATPTRMVYDALEVKTANGIAEIKRSLTESADLLPQLAVAVAKDPHTPVVILGPTGQMGRQFATLLLAAGHQNIVLWYFMGEKNAQSAAKILAKKPNEPLSSMRLREMEKLVALQALGETMGANIVSVDASGRLIDDKGSYPLPTEVIDAVNRAREFARQKTGKDAQIHFYNGFAGAPDMGAGQDAAPTTPNLISTSDGLRMAVLPTPKFDPVKSEGTIRTMGILHDVIYQQLRQQKGWIGSDSNIVTLTWSSREQLGQYLVSYSPTSALGRAKALLEQTSRERYAESEREGFKYGRTYTGHFPYFPSDASGAIFGMGLFQRVIGDHFQQIGAYPVPSRLATQLLIKTQGGVRETGDSGADIFVDQAEKSNLGPVIETIRLVTERARVEETNIRSQNPELAPDAKIVFDAETTARILDGMSINLAV